MITLKSQSNHSCSRVSAAVINALRHRRVRLALRIARVALRLAFWKAVAKLHKLTRLDTRTATAPSDLVAAAELIPPPVASCDLIESPVVTEDTTVIATIEATPICEVAAVDPRIEWQRFTSKFGLEHGSIYFVDGLTYQQALEREMARLEAILNQSETQLTRTESILNQIFGKEN